MASEHIIAEYDGYGSLTKKYIYGPGMDNPVVMINVDPQTQAETWYYYYADALGSIRLMSDASGSVVEGYAGACPERSRGNPYGKPYVMTSGGYDSNWMTEDPGATFSVNASGHAESAIGNPYLFTARRWHSVTGLYYYLSCAKTHPSIRSSNLSRWN